MALFALVALLLAAVPALARDVPATLSDVRGFNFTPAGADGHDGMWLNYDEQEINHDLDYAGMLRLNQTRVFLRYDAWNKDRATVIQSLNKFMDATAQRKIGVMIVLAYPGSLADGLEGKAQADGEKTLKDWTLDVVKTVKNKPSMRFWDVANEPDWDGYPEKRRPVKDREHRMQLARMMADAVHSLDKRNLVTVGCFREACMEELEPSSDVLSFHDYSPTIDEIDSYIVKAKAFSEKVHKPVFNTEMGCIGRGNPYDVMLREYKKADVGFYIWELMITQFWGDVHGVFYADGTVRDPSIAAALMGVFRNHGEKVVLEDPDREGWVTSSVADGKKWLAADSPDWKEGLKIAEVQANLLEAAQLVAMRYPPTRTVDLLRAGQPDVPALRKAMTEYVALLQPYVAKVPRNTH